MKYSQKEKEVEFNKLYQHIIHKFQELESSPQEAIEFICNVLSVACVIKNVDKDSVIECFKVIHEDVLKSRELYESGGGNNESI